MLHNAMLAIGTAFSDDPTLRDFKARMYFLEKAKSYIEDECSTPHLCAVQALSLIGSFHSGQGEQTLGYVFFGESYISCYLWSANYVFRHERSSWPSM